MNSSEDKHVELFTLISAEDQSSFVNTSISASQFIVKWEQNLIQENI